MKRILVTGGAGFLGSNLCLRLLNDGDEVISLDKVKSKNCYSILHDIIDPLPKIKVDEIYNLAGTPSPAKYKLDPIHTTKTNIIGTLNVLELAKSCNAKILQASTGEVYEDSDWTNIRACYRHGKRLAESLFFDYQRKYKLDIRIARMYNSYGPGMALNDGRVIPSFIQKAILNQDIEILGTGDQTRSFCYVDDMIDALILLMDSKINVFDIFNDEELTISDIAFRIIRDSGSKSKIIFKPILDDLNQKNPEYSLNLLNWIPKVNFNDGIKRTIDYFKEVINVGKKD